MKPFSANKSAVKDIKKENYVRNVNAVYQANEDQWTILI